MTKSDERRSVSRWMNGPLLRHWAAWKEGLRVLRRENLETLEEQLSESSRQRGSRASATSWCASRSCCARCSSTSSRWRTGSAAARRSRRRCTAGGCGGASGSSATGCRRRGASPPTSEGAARRARGVGAGHVAGSCDSHPATRRAARVGRAAEVAPRSRQHARDAAPPGAGPRAPFPRRLRRAVRRAADIARAAALLRRASRAAASARRARGASRSSSGSRHSTARAEAQRATTSCSARARTRLRRRSSARCSWAPRYGAKTTCPRCSGELAPKVLPLAPFPRCARPPRLYTLSPHRLSPWATTALRSNSRRRRAGRGGRGECAAAGGVRRRRDAGSVATAAWQGAQLRLAQRRSTP